MKKAFGLLTAALLLVCCALLPAGAESVITVNEELAPKTREETRAMLASATEAWRQDEALTAVLQSELSLKEVPDPFETTEDGTMIMGSLTHQGHTMQFMMARIGEPDEDGLYPLYLALHGGGESEARFNDNQWSQMFYYYQESVTSGIYIACRGITDTWDLHFRPESYPLYDRLIQAMIRLEQADPNRVYLLGFSAGGDGVYQIAGRMPDRFAAVNMSSGHPNGISLRNLANCPISIQVGVRDYYSEEAMRCIRAAEFEQVLSEYHRQLNYGYEHQVLVHVPEGHNYNDNDDNDDEVLSDPTAYADPAIREDMMVAFQQALSEVDDDCDVTSLSYFDPTVSPEFDEAVRRIVREEYHLETRLVDDNAVRYVSRFTRNPVPDTVVWDLSTRADSRELDSFYWLRADFSVTEGTVTATRNEADNSLTVTPENVNGDFSILVLPTLVDVSRPVRIITPDGEYTVQVNPSEDILLESMKKTGDPSLAWVAEIPYSLLH